MFSVKRFRIPTVAKQIHPTKDFSTRKSNKDPNHRVSFGVVHKFFGGFATSFGFGNGHVTLVGRCLISRHNLSKYHLARDHSRAPASYLAMARYGSGKEVENASK